MNSFVKELKAKPFFVCSDPVKEEEIDLAEKSLGLIFAPENPATWHSMLSY